MKILREQSGTKQICVQPALNFTHSYIDMSEIFEITGDDIKALRDDDLRALIGLLCEKDYRKANLATAGIKWGGHQDAPDGGFDVVVNGNTLLPGSYIPRANTAFQVKKPAMPPSEINKEMRPNGILRESISELIAAKGAYIIVSSSASTTEANINSRKAAMRAAILNVGSFEDLHLDFYDRGRVASWVRSHPVMTFWVREKIGQISKGWRSYGNWCMSPLGLDEGYLLDDIVRLRIRTETGDRTKNAVDSINYLRRKLSVPRAALRLVGLSGVGKTRFVQALFDDSIGENALNKTDVIYTDMSDGPQPSPTDIATYLIEENTKVVLIIDNCPPDLHKKLTAICIGLNSQISLLTIEYDVREDLPEETDVLTLEPASEKIISQLIHRRFPHINNLDRQTIAEFSGGNARVAIALSSTIKQGETIGRLRDEDLFKRLFHQTNAHDDGLLRSAEALSLVYSFNGVDISTKDSELEVLASILGSSVNELYRHVAELLARQLIQSRNIWRAILPHAIANRLAIYGLKSIPINSILNVMMQKQNKRLLYSFTHRLSFLHDNEQARQIAVDWLSPNSWLGQTKGDLDQFDYKVLKNIAPVAPEQTLALMEFWAHGEKGTEFVSRKISKYYDCVNLLWHIAYDTALFQRCVALICEFALVENPSENYNSPKRTLKSLFYIYLSGTLAPKEERVNAIRILWETGDVSKQNLALHLLDASCEAWHFISHQEFAFGARPRNWGWQPANGRDVNLWYAVFISLTVEFALSNSEIAEKAKDLLAKKFRGLWERARMHDELEIALDQLTKTGRWDDGWSSVRDTIKYNSEMDFDSLQRLLKVEKKMRPQNLLELSRIYTLSHQRLMGSIDEVEQIGENSYEDNEEKTKRIVVDLGRKVAVQPETFAALLPDLLKSNNTNVWDFGVGMAEGATDKIELWRTIRSAYNNIPQSQIGTRYLMGILSSDSISNFCDDILDELVSDPILGEYYPVIQMAVPITKKALERLFKALNLGKAPIHSYQYIGWGRAHEALNDEELTSYLRQIQLYEGGNEVALEILEMRFPFNESQHSDVILAFARNVLAKLDYTGDYRHKNYEHLSANLAKKCMLGPQAKDAAIKLSKTLGGLIKNRTKDIDNFSELLETLAELQPEVFLDYFLLTRVIGNRDGSIFSEDLILERRFLSKISEAEISTWCEVDPATRYPLILATINLFKHNEENASVSFNSFILQVLDRANNIEEILKVLDSSLIPPFLGRGANADDIVKYAGALTDLFNHHNEKIVSWATQRHNELLIQAAQMKAWDAEIEKRSNETFE